MANQRVRGFVVEPESGAPRAGAPVEFVAEVTVQDPGGPRTERVSIGILQSDRRGYLSAPLPLPEGTNRILGYPLGGEGREPVVEIDLGGAFDPARPHRIPVPPGPSPARSGFPAIVDPEAPDLAASPGSIGVAEDLLVGEGGCLSLLPSRAPTSTFRFGKIVREPSDQLEVLPHVPNDPESPCEYFQDITDTGPLCIRRGALFEYEMSWHPVGHALGEVVYSLPLAPCESVDLAVVDWSRDERIARTEATSLTEGLLHELRRDRALQETIDAVIREWQEGSSFMGGTAGAGGYQDFISGTHAIGGGNFSSSGERTVAADGVQRLADAVGEATSRVRDLRTTTVVQATEAERDVVQTRTVTNHNHCHALTVLYFQVVRHFRVRVRLARKGDVVFVKRRQAAFDPASHDDVVAHRRVLERFLLDPSLAKCFDALEKERCARVEFERTLTGPWGAEALEVGDLEFRLVTGEEFRFNVPIQLWLVTSWGESIPLHLVHEDGTFGPDPDIPGVGEMSGDEDIVTVRPVRRVRRDVVRAIKVRWTPPTGSRATSPWRLAELTVRTRDEAHGWVLYDDRPDLLFVPGDNEHTVPTLVARPPHAEDVLTAEERCCIDRLLLHLQTHSDHYNRALWLAEDPDTRARWLDRYTFDDGSRRGRLLDFVENRLLGTLGDSIILPLGGDATASKLAAGEPEPEERAVSLPGRGVFAEAKLGTCNSCEKRDPSRYWDWTESPCPERPPTISPVSLGSRARDRATPTPTSLGEGLSPTAPPAAPDAGAILSDVMEVLKTSEIFRDMSGREEVAAVLTELVKGAVEVNKAQIQQAGAAGGGSGEESSGEEGSGGGRGGSGGGTSGASGSEGGSGSGDSGASSSRAAREPSAATQMSDRLTVARQAVEAADLPEGERQALERRLAEGAVEEATESPAPRELRFRVEAPVPPGEEYDRRSLQSWAWAVAAMLGWREGPMNTPEALMTADRLVETRAGEATFQELFDGHGRPTDDPPGPDTRFGRLLAGLGLRRETFRPHEPAGGRLDAFEIDRDLRSYGPLWVTFTVGPGGSPSGAEVGQGGAIGLLVTGIEGDGSPEGTFVETVSSAHPEAPSRQSLQAFQSSLEFIGLQAYGREVYLIHF